jgi:PAS domain S-box-containing protein
MAKPHEDVREDGRAKPLGGALESATVPRAAPSYPPELGRGAACGHGSLSLNGDFLGADAALADILGRTPQELCTMTLRAVTAPEDVREDREAMDRIRRHEMEAYHLEKRVLHKDGHAVWVSQIVWAICDDRGTRLHLTCQLEPIDEPKAEGSRRAEESFRALIEHSPELIVVHREGRIVYVNAAVLAALGYPDRAALVGKDLAGDLLHPDDRDVAEERVGGADGERESRTSLPPLAVRLRRADGTYKTAETIAMAADFEGEPSVVVLARDVTERNEIQAQLLRSDRMAALGTLAAGVAHEINNPLTYLLVNVEHVLRRLRALAASNDPVEELESEQGGRSLASWVQSLAQAIEGANRVRQIVRDLMTFSQGNVEHRGLVDVRGVVESAIQMAWHEVRHRARLVKVLQEVPPVEANEARLGQVFLNLLVNAAQAIPEGDANNHVVKVATRADEQGRVVVEVTDTGKGIPKEALPRIFDPFFTTKQAGSGMGLGLSISHGTVKSLGGELKVESHPGRGTTFRVVLPAAKAYRGRAGGPQSTPHIRVAERKRILVIDDEPLVCDAVVRVLEDDNDIRCVTQATDALEIIKEGNLDLILCDLMMPVMTGMDLYAEVVRLAPQMAGRIVFMTGGAFTSRARAFLESVSNPCLEKPLDMVKLRSLIARAGERAAVRGA